VISFFGAVLTAALPFPAKDFVPVRVSYVAKPVPTIRGSFVEPAELRTLRIVVDGVDVTRRAKVWAMGFAYRPAKPLPPMRHDVDVYGNLRDGQPVSLAWQFTTGADTPAPRPLLTFLAPAAGQTVAQTFELSGRSDPEARIHVEAGVDAAASGVYGAEGGTFAGDVVADARGFFVERISLRTLSGVTLRVAVVATNPVTNQTLQKTLQLRVR
jgi:hypothetical protein